MYGALTNPGPLPPHVHGAQCCALRRYNAIFEELTGLCTAQTLVQYRDSSGGKLDSTRYHGGEEQPIDSTFTDIVLQV